MERISLTTSSYVLGIKRHIDLFCTIYSYYFEFSTFGKTNYSSSKKFEIGKSNFRSSNPVVDVKAHLNISLQSNDPGTRILSRYPNTPSRANFS